MFGFIVATAVVVVVGDVIVLVLVEKGTCCFKSCIVVGGEKLHFFPVMLRGAPGVCWGSTGNSW